MFTLGELTWESLNSLAEESVFFRGRVGFMRKNSLYLPMSRFYVLSFSNSPNSSIRICVSMSWPSTNELDFLVTGLLFLCLRT